jgi:hypothetical protein
VLPLPSASRGRSGSRSGCRRACRGGAEAREVAERIGVRRFREFYGDPVSLLEPYRTNRAYRWELVPRDLLALVKERPPAFIGVRPA